MSGTERGRKRRTVDYLQQNVSLIPHPAQSAKKQRNTCGHRCPLTITGTIGLRPKTANCRTTKGQPEGRQRLQIEPKPSYRRVTPNYRLLSPHNIYHDDAAHLIIKPDDVLQGRWKIIERLGRGTFGQVWSVKDFDFRSKSKSSRQYALKIAQSTEEARHDAEFEVDILKELLRRDPQAEHLFVKLLRSFVYHGHPCMLFEKLGESLHQFLSNRNFVIPCTMEQICHIAYQLCYGVGFLHQNGLTHTDLKTDNVVFAKCSTVSTDIRIIDFGSAVFDHENHISEVTTRQYRAPEVIFAHPWSYPCDVWSIGCILFELYTGNTLFQSATIVEMLAVMERVLGAVPENMIIESTTTYYSNGKLKYDRRRKAWRDLKMQCLPLKENIREEEKSEWTNALFDLLDKMLCYNPTDRITLKAALKHHFFSFSGTSKITKIPNPATCRTVGQSDL